MRLILRWSTIPNRLKIIRYFYISHKLSLSLPGKFRCDSCCIISTLPSLTATILIKLSRSPRLLSIIRGNDKIFLSVQSYSQSSLCLLNQQILGVASSQSECNNNLSPYIDRSCKLNLHWNGMLHHRQYDSCFNYLYYIICTLTQIWLFPTQF